MRPLVLARVGLLTFVFGGLPTLSVRERAGTGSFCSLLLICPTHFVRKLFNPQSLISHLTNSNGYGILQPKVLLTVSPFRSLLPPQPRVSSHLYKLCTRPLATSTVISYCCKLLVAPKKLNSFAIKKIQTLFAKQPGWAYVCDSSALFPSLPRKALTLFRINTCKSVTKQKTLSTCTINTYAKTGGRGVYLCDASALSASRRYHFLLGWATLLDSCRAGVRWSPLNTGTKP